MKNKKFVTYGIFIAACLLVSFFAGLVTRSNIAAWYVNLNKAWFNPPGWVFGPVWTVLYIMIGMAGARLWFIRQRASLAMRWYWLQLAINFSWSFVFFGAQSVGGGLIVIITLWLAILMTILSSWFHDKIAALLLVPYFAWVSFATLLNFSLYALN